MKKVITLIAFAGIVTFVACGPSAEEKAAMEAKKQDSITAVEKAKADSAAAAQAAIEKAKADSIAAAAAAQAQADSAKAAEEAASKGKKK
ncbi:MAG: hypothetical protein IT235_06945 [Bacteroidia bacterium]|nr:hypothetical protein [Bacteroidia bacterium]